MCLIYPDGYNLCGWAMSQQHPVGNFEWNNDIKKFSFLDVLNIIKKRYILKVDLDNSSLLQVIHLFLYCFKNKVGRKKDR